MGKWILYAQPNYAQPKPTHLPPLSKPHKGLKEQPIPSICHSTHNEQQCLQGTSQPILNNISYSTTTISTKTSSATTHKSTTHLGVHYFSCTHTKKFAGIHSNEAILQVTSELCNFETHIKKKKS